MLFPSVRSATADVTETALGATLRTAPTAGEVETSEFARALGMKPICDKAAIATAAIPILTRTNSLPHLLD